MDNMGGLLKRMPRTGSCFIINALSLCGLPPFAGFAGEFIIYMAAFAGLNGTTPAVMTLCIAALISLALTGGLAAAAMSKAVGAVFCGEPRSSQADEAREVPAGMTLPVLFLTVLSIALLFVIPEGIRFFFGGEVVAEVEKLCGNISMVCMISFAVSVLTILLWTVRMLMVRRTGERISPTWDCGYARPEAKMEYTATSFSQNQVDFFRWILKPLRKITLPQGAFPEKADLEESIPDGGIEYFWQKIFSFTGKIADRIHVLQSGSLHFYLLVVVITMAVMLVCAVYGGK
jgi:NADH:ubiquinone oxidoreductase subunit 5 (subunit L)/multisubunit Na+/H+ antiporter MnhA subunit